MLGFVPERKDGKPLKLLCLGAHSDDIEIGCGATLNQWIQNGLVEELKWMVFSGNTTRAEEARASAEHWLAPLEHTSIDLHHFRDGFFPEEWSEIKEAFEVLKKEYNPDLILTHYREDRHQDHRTIHDLTCNTFRNHMILEYEIPKYDGDLGQPNFFVPVSREALDFKTDALLKYFGTQGNKHWFSEELFSGLMRIRGMEAASESGYAEGFYARKFRISG